LKYIPNNVENKIVSNALSYLAQMTREAPSKRTASGEMPEAASHNLPVPCTKENDMASRHGPFHVCRHVSCAPPNSVLLKMFHVTFVGGASIEDAVELSLPLRTIKTNLSKPHAAPKDARKIQLLP
jgi:hypothetical protein